VTWCPQTNSTTHAAGCGQWQLVCTHSPHTHTSGRGYACRDVDGNVTCTTDEHTHTPREPCHGYVHTCGGN
jgi:hypothetical protein